MSNKILDNGTILTLGLVGAVAAIGVAAKRGVYGSRSTATASVMEDILDHLNDAGFNFEMMDDHLLMDDSAKVSISADSPLDEAQGPTMVEVARRIEDRNGNLVSLKVLGQFSTRDLAGITRALHRRDHRGSRATAMVGDRFEWPRTNSYSFEEYRRNAGIRDMDEFRADLRRKMSDPRSDSSQNYAGVEHTPGAVPEYNRKPHATMKAAVAAATKLAKGGGRPVVHSVGYSGRIYTRYVDERGFGESLLEEFGSDRYPRPLPRKGGSRATSASKAPSIGEYDDFVVATKSRGNKHAYYIEGHDGDLDDGWYYNGITWGVDLVGPYDNAAEALRKA